MFTETPTPTIVLMPRLRRTESRSVPVIGPTPCVRVSTMSEGSGPSSGSTEPPGLPGDRSAFIDLPAMNSRAFVLDPRPSGRRWMRQCTTVDVCGPGCVDESGDVRDRLPAGLLGQHRQAGLKSDDATLTFLGDQGGRGGVEQIAEVRCGHENRRYRVPDCDFQKEPEMDVMGARRP